MRYALLSVTYSGLFYAGEALSIEGQIVKARELGFDALAIETKRPVASPIDLTKAARARIKAAAADHGIALCALESLSSFASPLMEERENNLAMMRAVLELASDLGVDVPYDTVVDYFNEIFIGPNHGDGLIQRESWFPQNGMLERNAV